MKKALKFFLAGVALLALIAGGLLFKAYRDIAEIKKIAADFKPELVKVSGTAALSENQKMIADSCLNGDFGQAVAEQNKATTCRCLAVNMDRYISPLLPQENQGRASRFVTMYKNSEEIAAKGAVLLELCSRKTAGK